MNTAGVLLEVEVDEEGQLRYFALLSILALVVRTVHKLFFQLNDWHRNTAKVRPVCRLTVASYRKFRSVLC